MSLNVDNSIQENISHYPYSEAPRPFVKPRVTACDETNGTGWANERALNTQDITSPNRPSTASGDT